MFKVNLLNYILFCYRTAKEESVNEVKPESCEIIVQPLIIMDQDDSYMNVDYKLPQLE